MHGIVAYTFLNIYKKIHQFLSSIKRDTHKRKLVPFSASRCTCTTTEILQRIMLRSAS